MTRCSLALLVVLAACDIPTRADVEEATGDAVDQCREVLQDQIPGLVVQLAAAAFAACQPLVERIADTQDAVRDTAYHVLVALGCSWDGKVWDCSTAPLLCGGTP